MAKKHKNSIFTRSVHAGEEKFKYAGSVTEPVVQTAPFVFKNMREVLDFQQKKASKYEYSRLGNPTVIAAEKRLAALEDAEDCILFDSGMGAVVGTFLALLNTGDHIVATDDAYKSSLGFLTVELARRGIECTVVPFGDYAAMEAAVRPSTKIIFSESPSNPRLNVLDLEKLKVIRDLKNVTTVVDSTFATPFNQRPIEWGVDIVIHSATKYLAGHNDIIAGAVLGRREKLDKIREFHKATGGVFDPHACSLLLRGLKTFALRVDKQNRNGQAVAEALEKHPRVKHVFYPGLKSHPHHDVAKRQMTGFGGVVSIRIDGDRDSAFKFLDALEMILIAPSLGGVETLVMHPATMNYFNSMKIERESAGITDDLIRIALGIEDADDIIADLENALAAIR